MSDELVIVIPTAGRHDLLRRTLQSIADARKPAGYKATVVIENGSRGGAEHVADCFSALLGARYMFVEKSGKSAALNAALDKLGDCLAVFFDDDVRIGAETLCAYAQAASGAQAGLFFGGPTGVDHEQAPPEWLANYLPRSARGWQRSSDRQTVDFLGFNWAAFTRDLRAVGGFDPQRGPGSVDGSTIGDEGYIRRQLLSHSVQGVYVPEAWVWHYVPADRCSAQWIIDRNYRHGIECGKRTEVGTATLFGYPPWVLRRWMQGLAKTAITCVSRDPLTRFRDEHRRSYNRGLMRGVQMRRRAQAALATPAQEPSQPTGQAKCLSNP